MMNFTNATTEIVFQNRFGWVHFWLTLCLLGAFILCTIVGNVFVVAAILLEKHLQGVSNYLILSLAVADLMVATLPMPISAINEVSRDWWLGNALCDFWVCSDVLCCTASIMHLVGIALDRYWAVTNAEYIRKRTAKRIGFMITVFWLLSIAISLPARFTTTRLTSWIQPVDTVNISFDEYIIPDCGINKEYGYTIFSTVVAFYMPMFFIICIYARIYMVAKARIRRSTFRKKTNSPNQQTAAKNMINHNWTKWYDSKASHWTRHYICYNCFGRASDRLSDRWIESEHAKSSVNPSIATSAKKNDAGVSVVSDQYHCYRRKFKKSPSNTKCTREKDKTVKNEVEWRQKTDVISTWKTPCQVAQQKDASIVGAEPNNELTTLQRALCVTRHDRDRNASINIAQCYRCLGQILPNPVEQTKTVRLVWNRISHSAPPSVFDTSKPSYSSASSSFDSSCYTVNRSDKSDVAAWSSSCSVDNRAKYTGNQTNQKRRFYTVMKTFISHRKKTSLSPNTDVNEPCQVGGLKKSKWTLPKLGSRRRSRGNFRPHKGKPNGRKISKSCLDSPRGQNDNNTSHNDTMFDIRTIQPAEQDITGDTVNKACPTQSTGLLETDDVSGGTIHLEARLKSTVSEVTKLATVTAMVKRERLENQRERKAVITLAIITGCFMLCWLPFFIVALIAPFYDQMKLSKVGQGIVLWLGYSNSLLNPMIYTIFSPDFRNAFRKILFGRYYLRYRDR
ncbi:5-hydroxytryptamine receptor [Fasciola hepatica]|uniref:5-hydroxytryptamine receptor n=1 Tax=Fasciola hepatica TaxID=6192 RepID=A0A4E0S346_FASHE|nr:5-hydroxytryptamine receptor [Fasciola hepatica]